MQGQLFDAAAARRAADEAIAQVDDHADPRWKGAAKDAVREACRRWPEWSTDDLWRAGLPFPRERRAMGAIIRWAMDEGLIAKTGRTRPSIRPVCHANPKTLWRSRVFGQEPVFA